MCSPIEGHLGCFQVLAIMNKLLENIHVQFFFFFGMCMCVWMWVFRLRQIIAMRCKEILSTWNLGLFCVSCILYWNWCQAAKIIVPLIEAFLATCAFSPPPGWCWLGCCLYWPGGWGETEVFLFWSLFSFASTWASFQPADPGKAFYYGDECHSSVAMWVILHLAFSISSPRVPSPAPTVAYTFMSILNYICVYSISLPRLKTVIFFSYFQNIIWCL